MTGRRHQLRVHCSDVLSRPIVGDYTYTDGNDSETQRMYLHAMFLKVPNKVEDIDLKTQDPYEGDSDYVEEETIFSLERALEIFEREKDSFVEEVVDSNLDE